MIDLTRTIRVALTVLALNVALPHVGPLAAQSAIEPEWAAQFVGSWRLTLETPDGGMPVTVKIGQDEEGVEAQVGFPEISDDFIEDVTRAGEALLLRFTVPVEGNDFAIALRLTRDGEALRTNWDVQNGEFLMDARATRE